MTTSAAARRYTIDCDVLEKMSAAYLRVQGDECAFIEAHTAPALPKLLAELDRHKLDRASVRYVVVTHAHLDHAGGASALMEACPNATLLAHPSAAKNLIDPARLIAGATEVYGAERFARLYGDIKPIDRSRVRALKDGETFELGNEAERATFTVHHTAGHAWHHFVVDDPATDTVFTGDAFGLVYPRIQRNGLFAFASTSPTGFDAEEAMKSIDRIVGLGRSSVCPTHFGEVRDVADAAAQLRMWIEISRQWRDEAREAGGEFAAQKASIEAKFKAKLVEEASARGLTFDAGDWELLATDIDLNAQGLAFAAQKR